MADLRIERGQKNIMREQMETVLALHKEVGRRIDDYEKETEVQEYRNFWQEMRRDNSAAIQKLSYFMVRKCNR